METKTGTRAGAEEALLDAAERLLIEAGYAAITTRRVAAEAGVNHGLVHYYFGSNENLLVQALERFTERLIARQRELYAAASAGRSERPLPRPSNATTRQWRARYGICIFQWREWTSDHVGRRSTVGSPEP